MQNAIQRDSFAIEKRYVDFRYQMSEKNVYDALAEDFDPLETS